MDVHLRASGVSLLRSLKFEDQDHRRSMLFFFVSHAWQTIGEEMDVSILFVTTREWSMHGPWYMGPQGRSRHGVSSQPPSVLRWSKMRHRKRMIRPGT
eukprot:5693942-Prymnesium_polylepis.1